mmetsp:Transcript_151431/g.275558  ORF Transcript_151431/g.275558 Transcript_151431/m.275558 type:complete len:286 (+) Transcript_151431:382-1239(+)
MIPMEGVQASKNLFQALHKHGPLVSQCLAVNLFMPDGVQAATTQVQKPSNLQALLLITRPDGAAKFDVKAHHSSGDAADLVEHLAIHVASSEVAPGEVRHSGLRVTHRRVGGGSDQLRQGVRCRMTGEVRVWELLNHLFQCQWLCPIRIHPMKMHVVTCGYFPLMGRLLPGKICTCSQRLLTLISRQQFFGGLLASHRLLIGFPLHAIRWPIGGMAPGHHLLARMSPEISLALALSDAGPAPVLLDVALSIGNPWRSIVEQLVHTICPLAGPHASKALQTGACLA